jgi:primosomal protein N' (replication factor Y)
MQTFSYGVPQGMAARVGMAAYVPFGKLTLQGIIVEVHTTPVFSEPEKIREIRSLVGEAPLIDEHRIALARWISHEYLAPIFDAVALFLPPGFERKPQSIIHALVPDHAIDSLALPPRQRETLAAVSQHSPVIASALREQVETSGLETALAALEKRGLIMREYTLTRPTIGAKSVEVAELAVPLTEALERVRDREPPKRSRRASVLKAVLASARVGVAEATKLAGSRANLDRLIRADIIRVDGDAVALAVSEEAAAQQVAMLTTTRRHANAVMILTALEQSGELDVGSLRKDLRVDTATVRRLAEIGAIKISARAVERDPLADFHVVRRPPAILLPAQERAAAAVCASIESRNHETFLLHGVTGSGKTEVYLQALDRCIALGLSAIVLVPEISLTPQTIRRFRERFDRVAVLHSGLTDGELFDQWHGIAAGRFDVVIGARSALFAPQPDLGLIVIDEEHEWTYKQNDPQPRYHARAVAIELARRKNAAVVLGSATPDVVSYDRASRGAYTFLTLEERIRPIAGANGVVQARASLAMPRIDVVDLREELRAGNTTMFSSELRFAVEASLRNDEQSILFLNRRGLAGHVQCRDCGFVPECGSCAVALTYHRQYDRLVCHQCNKRWRLPAKCKQCGSPRVRLLGAGVEKVEAEAARLFPHARLLRWDRDATRTRGAHDRILAAFLAREADILIGTQMLAKGLDMPAVTVVGVMNADTSLHLPDFRTGERTFQLLTQVAGRAGRGERPGRVIIQTYTPDHYAIAAATGYDYEGFVSTELASRQRAGYPPFGRLVKLIVTHPNERWSREEALRMQRVLTHRRSESGALADVIGPAPAYVPRVRGRWRWQIILRGDDPANLLRELPLPPHWSIDVDPASLV